MNHRIQIIVDDRLNNNIKSGARKLGLSTSAYARLVLMNGLSGKNGGLLSQALRDVQAQDVESLSLDEFNEQIDKS